MAKLKSYINGSWVELGGASIIEDTYANIKALRDESKLVKGQLYRITNYVAYTSQSNTQSANKQFDIIVLADSANSFNENAWAINHTFGEGETDPFASCNLKAWEIKYCFDQDSTRFSWGGSSTYDHSEVDGKTITYTGKELNLIDLAGGIRSTGYYVCKDADNKTYYSLSTSLESVSSVYENLNDFLEDTGGVINTLSEDKTTFTSDWAGSMETYTLLTDGTGECYDVYINNEKYLCYSDSYGNATAYVKESALAVGATLFCLNFSGSTSLEDEKATTKVYTTPEGFRGIIYHMKDEWGNEASFDFKGIQIQNTIVASCSQSTYLSSTYWVDKYIPTGSTIYGYTLGTDTAWYYLFGNTADTDKSLTGTCINNVAKFTGNSIPLWRIHSSDNTVISDKNYIVINASSYSTITNSTNIFIASSNTKIDKSTGVTLGNGGDSNDIIDGYNIAANALNYTSIEHSNYLVINSATKCRFEEGTSNIYSAASTFNNNSFIDVQYVYISSTTAQFYQNTLEHCIGTSSEYAINITVAGQFYRNKIYDSKYIYVTSGTPIVSDNTINNSNYIIISSTQFVSNSVINCYGTSSNNSIQAISGKIGRNHFQDSYNIKLTVPNGCRDNNICDAMGSTINCYAFNHNTIKSGTMTVNTTGISIQNVYTYGSSITLSANTSNAYYILGTKRY